MKILLTGVSGQVGWELARTLSTMGEIISCDRQTLDLCSEDNIRNTIRAHKPDLIVNPAAYTAVDKAESEQKLASLINTNAPAIIAEEVERLGSKLVHFSTDYVFNGQCEKAYKESDIPEPINVYGKTKLAGEEAIRACGIPHLIFRTSWVYSGRGNNFLLTMLKLMRERDSLSIVSDQFGAPTWSRTIAEACAQSIIQWAQPDNKNLDRQSGTYNLTSQGRTNWFEFASEIQSKSKSLSNEITLNPISTSEYPVAAARPVNSSLCLDKIHDTFNLSLPHWRVALEQCLQDHEQGA